MKKILFMIGSITVAFSILAVVVLKSFHDQPMYHTAKIVESYIKLGQEFHYTMERDKITLEDYQINSGPDALFQWNNNDPYFTLEYSNHEIITVGFMRFPTEIKYFRSFFLDLTQIESDPAAMRDILSATCMVADKSLNKEEANALAEQFLEDPDTPVSVGNYTLYFVEGELMTGSLHNKNLWVTYKDEVSVSSWESESGVE